MANIVAKRTCQVLLLLVLCPRNAVQSFVHSRGPTLVRRLSQIMSGDSSDESLSGFVDLLRPPKDSQVNRMSSTDLAYVGDALYELFVRSRTVWPPKRTSDLQNQVVRLVRGMYGTVTRTAGFFAIH